MEQVMVEAMESMVGEEAFRYLSMARAQHMRAVQDQVTLIQEQTAPDERTKLLQQQMKRSHRQHLPLFHHFRDTQLFSTLTQLPNNFDMLHLLPEASSYLNIYLSADKRVLNVGFLRVL